MVKQFILLVTVFISVTCYGQKVNSLTDCDTTLFHYSFIDGVWEVFLRDTMYRDGKYIIRSCADAKKVVMRFEIKNGKPCGEMIKYSWSGKVLYKKNYGKCR